MCSLLKWCCLLLGFICLFTETSGLISSAACGVRQVKTTFLIHHGSNALPGHWPWHVALFHGDFYKCGGSIIDGNTILTAAHCVYLESGVIQKSLLSVYLGQKNLKGNSTYAKCYDVQKIIVHPKFDPVTIHHDIALIKVGSNITMNKFVQPVCLWTMDSKQELIKGTKGAIVGFGHDENDVISDQLKQASVDVLDPLTCIELDRDVFGTHLTSNMFCGKGQVNVSACGGDSGGGMFFEVRGKWFVRGLVSFIPSREQNKLCNPQKPTGFTDVAKYLNWIKPHIDQRVLSNETGAIYIGNEEKLSLFNFTTCGIKSSTYTDPNQGLWTLPWMGSLYVTKENPLDDPIENPRCSVTLISEWYAVGPAHCFENEKDEIFIVLGSYYEPDQHNNGRDVGICYLTSEPCPPRSQTRRVKRVFTYPRSGKQSGVNDVALFELMTPVDTTQANVQPICLPITSELRTNATTNLRVAVHDSSYSYINLPIRFMDKWKCMKKYAKQSILLNMGTNQECLQLANTTYAGTCYDSKVGSPLQVVKLFNGTERYFLHGFFIRGSSCETYLPPVYINAEPYLDWILYKMRYNTQEKLDALRNLPFESEVSTLLREPGMEKLRLLNMDICGVADATHRSVDHVPWIGFLYQNTKELLESSHYHLAVLVSQWYALAPKQILNEGFVGRYLLFGKYSTENNYQLTYQQVEIRNIIIPPSDNASQIFMLIELLEPADLTNPYIKPICLPFMERLRQPKPTEVEMVFVDPYSENPAMEILNLTVIDLHKCKQQLLVDEYSVPLQNNSICALETEIMRETYLYYKLGTPFQIPAWFQGYKRYFLHGMYPLYYTALGNLKNNIDGTQLYFFDTVELVHLQWMLENMEEKERKTSFLSTKWKKRVNLDRLELSNSTMDLFNMQTCGKSSSSYPAPWIGYTEIRKGMFGSYRCLVTLINELYAVGPANCFNWFNKNVEVVFGSNTNKSLEDCSSTMNSEPCAQTVKIERVFRHPQNNGYYKNDVALLQLATRVNVSHPNVRPICLPIVDDLRSYDTSSLDMVAYNTSSLNLNILDVTDRYVNAAKCRKRWLGLKANVTIDSANHCVINQRLSNEDCVKIPYGASLHSRQRLGSSERHFLRGFALDRARRCSIYYPIVYTNTDAHLKRILEAMVQLKSP